MVCISEETDVISALFPLTFTLSPARSFQISAPLRLNIDTALESPPVNKAVTVLSTDVRGA